MPIRRERAFAQIALNRARSLTLFVSRLGLDDGAVDALRRDSLISVSESSVSQITPSHDVLEDWAILQWIGDIYERHSTNISGFCEELGAYPACFHYARRPQNQRADQAQAKICSLPLHRRSLGPARARSTAHVFGFRCLRWRQDRAHAA